MIILSLDTTTRAGSLAVLRDRELLAELVGDPTLTHGQRLPADVQNVLEHAQLAVDRVDLLAVTVGPGSFTGLRVGIATMQGLAMARALRVVPVTTLEALGFAAAGRAAAIGAWMDAQRGEVFATLYEADGRSVRVPPVSSRPERVLEDWSRLPIGDDVVFIGDGAVRYRDVIGRVAGPTARIEPAPPLATVAGLIAAGDPVRAVLPHAVVPVYVRKSDAELARDRRSDRP